MILTGERFMIFTQKVIDIPTCSDDDESERPEQALQQIATMVQYHTEHCTLLR